MVAPINVIAPLSTCGRKMSCCNLLNRWISSMNKIVLRWNFCSFLATVTACLTSATPAMVADSFTKRQFCVSLHLLAMMWASVVCGEEKIQLLNIFLVVPKLTTYFSNARRSPQNHTGHFILVEYFAQHRVFAHYMALANVIVNGFWAHFLSQRHRFLDHIVFCFGRCCRYSRC